MILIGWLVVFGLYVMTYVASHFLLAPFLRGAHLRAPVEVGAIIMATLPYAAAGLAAKQYMGERAWKAAFWISVVPVLCERAIAIGAGYHFIATRFSSWNLLTVIYFVQWKSPAYFFTPAYVLEGLLSVVVCMVVARLAQPPVRR